MLKVSGTIFLENSDIFNYSFPHQEMYVLIEILFIHMQILSPKRMDRQLVLLQLV